MAVQRVPKKKDIFKAIKVLERSSVLVGIPAAATGQDAEGRSVQYAALGYIFETGAPEINMPPRPWLGPGIATAEAKIAKLLADGGKKLLSGGSTGDYEATLHKVGLTAQSAIQKHISDGIDPPLSERTIYARIHRRKNRRSPGKMTPLIDTGGFRNSITYSVRVWGRNA